MRSTIKYQPFQVVVYASLAVSLCYGYFDVLLSRSSWFAMVLCGHFCWRLIIILVFLIALHK
jgi:hypothetical protein